MKASPFPKPRPQMAASEANPSQPNWRRLLRSVRLRILIWYFLLTACTSAVSLLVTQQIFCNRIEARAKESLSAEVERFERLQTEPANKTLSTQLDRFFASYTSAPNEFAFAFLDGQLYRSSSNRVYELLAHQPNLLQEWAALEQQTRGRIAQADGPLLYVVQPLRQGNQTRGGLVALRDSSADYQVGNETIWLVIQVTLAVLAIFSWLAWKTAGRAIAPLRQVTETARTISDSDMTQRIPVQGNDEIAELTHTFNAMLDRLQAAFDTQQQFLNDAGHELRTPIAVIQGHLEVLQYRPERQAETLQLVFDELERMNRLVNDLLLLAKSARPDFLHLRPEELDWLTEELYLKARVLAQRNWRLESKGLSPVVVDRGRFTQAVMNLVQNAVRHTQVGDTIALGSSVHDEYAYFWVHDTGEGIGLKQRDRIFDRFTRNTDTDRYAPGEGAGLGLAIVQAIAQAHQGWIELESKQGIGSTFTLVFPLNPPSEDESDSDRRGQSTDRRISRSRTASERFRHLGGY